MVHFRRCVFEIEGRVVLQVPDWSWHCGQNWAVLGPVRSGHSLFAEAVAGKFLPTRGEVLHHLRDRTGPEEVPPEHAIALLTPRAQHELLAQESSFYQSRWHSGMEEGTSTVASFLAQEAVEGVHPFEVGSKLRLRSDFRALRRQVLAKLALTPLLRRRIQHLSNGERQKLLLARLLLRQPLVLVLDQPFAGLDPVMRPRLEAYCNQLMRDGLPVMVVSSRLDEVPVRTTHILLFQGGRIVAQGPRDRVWPRCLRLLGSLKEQEPIRSDRPLKPAPTASSKPVLELFQVTISGAGKKLLQGVNWTVRAGEHWAVFGHNGAGKTTLLSLIQGDHPQVYAQDVRLFGQRLGSTQTLWRVRERIGSMSPELLLHYPPAWSCLEVACSGFFQSVGLHQTCTRTQIGIARSWLTRLGLGLFAEESSGALPGGHQRMVLLARAFVRKPRLLILDEPCLGLDTEQRKRLLETVDEMVAKTRATLLLVTHHPGELPSCISHALELRRGRIANLQSRLDFMKSPSCLRSRVRSS